MSMTEDSAEDLPTLVDGALLRDMPTTTRGIRTRAALVAAARVVFERDGEVRLDGTATRLGFDGAIFVELHDRRMQTVGAWLPPDDVWWPGK